MSSAAPVNEFPTLDLDEFDTGPLRPAVLVAALERYELPGILAAALPSVVHARHRREDARLDEHQFIDAATGAAVRYVVRLNERNEPYAQVAESGPQGLFDRLVVACADWERAGRPDPSHWQQPLHGADS